MKYVNQLEHPHLMYKAGKPLDYDFYLRYKKAADAAKFMSNFKVTPDMKPITLNNGVSNVAVGGCGLCCAVMAADRLTPNSSFALEDALELAYASGGNGAAGTDYGPFAPAFAEKMNYDWKGTASFDDVDEWLATGGVAVVEVAGDRQDGHIGVFTHGWHFMLLLYKRADGKYAILDPSQTPTKYDEEGRKGLVEVDGNIIYASKEVLWEEAKDFDVPFYLFRRK